MTPRYLSIDGIQLAVWERPGIEPSVFLAHATGFHAHCWDAVTDQLVERSIGYDMRGHGASGGGRASWRRLGEDATAVVRALGLRGAIGAGHSLGGHSLILAAAALPGAFAHLLLLDPVILPEAAYDDAPAAPHYARKRRSRWDSPAAMAASFRNRPPFADWDAQVLEDYCEYALRPAPDGDGLALACDPECEAAIYEGCRARDANLYAEIEALATPVTIVRSARPFLEDSANGMLASATAPGAVSRFRNATGLIHEASHFIPMEQPEWVAAQIAHIARQLRGEEPPAIGLPRSGSNPTIAPAETA